MKTNLILLALVIFTSCSNSNKYEKAIADFLQTDKKGTWTDMKFKVIDIEEEAPVTVADSIKILKENFEQDTSKRIENLEKTVQSNKESLEKEKKGYLRSKMMIGHYESMINKAENAIDSLKNITFTSIYDNEDSNKILLQPVRCKYSFVYPGSNTTSIETAVFYINPDDMKCVFRTRIKE